MAPFYWHFEDDSLSRTSTVIVPGLPISWSRQPGATSFGIWPLFYRSTKFGWAAPLLGSFEITDPDKAEAYGAVTFLYWWSRSPKKSLDTLIPLFVSSRSPASAFTFALPLNFYWRTGAESHTLAIPFFLAHSWKEGASAYSLLGYFSHQGTETRGSVAWLYWGGRDRKTHDAYDVVLPLLWSFRSPDSATTTLFPIVWSFRRGDGWLNTVVPFWWSAGGTEQPEKGQDEAPKASWRFRTLIPLFYWSESASGAKSSWLTVLGGYHRDDTAGARTALLLARADLLSPHPGHGRRPGLAALLPLHRPAERQHDAPHLAGAVPARRAGRLDHRSVSALLALSRRPERSVDHRSPAVLPPARHPAGRPDRGRSFSALVLSPIVPRRGRRLERRAVSPGVLRPSR